MSAYNDKLSEKAAILKSMIDCANPDLLKIEGFVKTEKISPFEMASAFIQYLDDNVWEYSDTSVYGEYTEESIIALHTINTSEILEILTASGMDLDARFCEMSILSTLIFVDTLGIAASIAHYVLSHGGSGDIINDCGENFFEEVESEITFVVVNDEGKERLDYLFQLYMIALGFGCTPKRYEMPTVPVDGFDF